MKVFVDASVFVAILAGETDGPLWAEKVRDVDVSLTSSIASWEAVRAIARLTRTSIAQAFDVFGHFCLELGIELTGIGSDETREALDAQVRFGKGNHPAKLNMGDCFAYACAKTNNATLLYKGDDFTLTDLA